ncbi:MAG: DUF5615 family PIN-like protein [Dehalococcoidia bacterium]
MPYYLDANLSPKIVAAVKRLDPAIDVIAARAVGHDHWTDPEQLRYAAREGRVLVTQDRKDFNRIGAEFVAIGEAYTGSLMLPGSISTKDIGLCARALVRFDHDHPDGVPSGYVDFLRADNS